MTTHHAAPVLPSPSLSPSLSSSRDFMTCLFNSLTSPIFLPSPMEISDADTISISGSSSCTRRVLRGSERVSERDCGDGDMNGNGNPLKQIDAQKKALLMTLHVIFPPPLLLHALDLLDRGGVGRVVLKREGGAEEEMGMRPDLGNRRDGAREDVTKDSRSGRKKEVESDRSMEVEDTTGGETAIDAYNPKVSPSTCTSTTPSPSPNKHHSPLPSTHRSPRKTHTKPTRLYQVRSSQPPKWHSSRSASGAGSGIAHASAENTYTVHLDAWNCSCAAFAFSAFPASSSSSSSSTHSHPYISTSPSSTSYLPWALERSLDGEYPIPENKEKEEEEEKGEEDEEEEEEEEKWQYGGWTKTSQVPICKHLLACLLVERWGDVLGTYVRERAVGREEMGGLVV
ncbi:hypothetical protein BGAL_0178g00090 [Botrytis galanthina]|uniref:SWIM-type domain-containing protein n=1 Tax=Botrytis galanthina TaxID=278940 RepID=A0A4S8R005_9HELO|nr:hypothetical protein BGAL_0178g00090 [Botrytis galanthina]